MKINENTVLPLSLIGVVLSLGAGASWWMSALYVRVANAESTIDTVQQAHEEFKGDVMKELRDVNGTLIEIKTILQKDGKEK